MIWLIDIQYISIVGARWISGDECYAFVQVRSVLIMRFIDYFGTLKLIIEGRQSFYRFVRRQQ